MASNLLDSAAKFKEVSNFILTDRSHAKYLETELSCLFMPIRFSQPGDFGPRLWVILFR